MLQSEPEERRGQSPPSLVVAPPKGVKAAMPANFRSPCYPKWTRKSRRCCRCRLGPDPQYVIYRVYADEAGLGATDSYRLDEDPAAAPLQKCHRIEALFLEPQARLGLGQPAAARGLLDEVLRLDQNHPGATDLRATP